MNNFESSLYNNEEDDLRNIILESCTLLNKIKNAISPILTIAIVGSVTLSIIANYIIFYDKNSDFNDILITKSNNKNIKNISNLILKSIKFVDTEALIIKIDKSVNDKNKITPKEVKHIIDKTLIRYAEINDCIIFDKSSNINIYGAEDIIT